MRIKIKEKSYEQVLELAPAKREKPIKQRFLFRLLLRIVSMPDLIATKFKCKKIGMERLGRREPCLVLMNHSSFIDLKIASTVLFPRQFHIVCTQDGFVGKKWLMRHLGCIPTKKFVTDLSLVRDMIYATKTLGSSVLMYPEAGYSFDGRATALPDHLGRFIKLLGVPVVMIRTSGAFLRDPLYNNLQLRRVRVSAEMEYLLSAEEIEEKSADELQHLLAAQFDFDAFRHQQENRVRVGEAFRADHLDRLLYRCPACGAEGTMRGKGVTLCCGTCGKTYTLDEYGTLKAKTGETEFSHIPDWYDWQRACVRREVEQGLYHREYDVDIYLLADTKALYRVGQGQLVHSADGFHLTGCDGKLSFSQGAGESYTLNADFNWYEIGDVICVGDHKRLYYCFPRGVGSFVTKARLATEELYKIVKEKKERAKKIAAI